jgi:hypothetical protein
MLGFVPQPNLHGLRFLGKTYAVLASLLPFSQRERLAAREKTAVAPLKKGDFDSGSPLF